MDACDIRQADRKGFALMLVLTVVAIATTMGLACVLTSTTRLVASRNLANASRARYLAESGLAHALQVLRANPSALDGSGASPIGPFAIDQTNDTYAFWGQADPSAPGRYYLWAQGTAGQIARSCSYTVFRNAGVQNSLYHALTIDGSAASLPGSLEVTGDIHNNGAFLLNLARVHGNVSSHGAVIDPFHLIDGDIVNGAEQIDSRDIAIEPYQAYALSGRSCFAVQVTGDSFDADSEYCNGQAVSPGNIGGVVWLQGDNGQDVRITDGVDFEGTVIVDGNLILEGRGILLTAVNGFPAVVTTGQLKIDPYSQATINGVVMARGGIGAQSAMATGSSTVVNGGIATDVLGYDPTVKGDHKLTYVSESCRLYDFGGGDSSAVTLTILDYH
jgi:Tfp pilus assembly protein PilX